MRFPTSATAVLGIAALAATFQPGSLYAQETATDPRLAVTVYANGLALVDEMRHVPVSSDATLRINRVGPRMIADSVRLTPVGGPGVVEISLDSDLLTPQALLRRSLGKTVKIIRTNPATGSETIETAEVLSINGGTVLRFDDRIETGTPGRIAFDGVPADLNAEPALSVRFTEPPSTAGNARLTYLTEGLSWEAVYTVELARDYASMALDGWAKVTNGAGLDFEKAALSLVAGDVRREAPMPPRPVMMMRSEAVAADAKIAMPVRQELAAFHMYGIPGRVTLKDRETKQLRLLSAGNVQTKRLLESRSGVQVFGTVRGNQQPQPARQSIVFKNVPEAGLGQPLPAGLVRVYVADTAGQMRFAGEDRIDNTPSGNEVTVELGQAFDVTVDRRQTSFKRVGEKTTEAAFAIVAANAGTAPAEVRIVDDIPGDWDIYNENRKHTRDGASAVWTVTVPAAGKIDINYKVRVSR